MKKLICLALLLCLLLSLLAGCALDAGSQSSTGTSKESEPVGTVEPAPGEEIQKAIDLGFVPESLRGDYDAQITYTEFCSILDNLISVVRPDCLDNWKKASSRYRSSRHIMKRAEGMLVFLYAAECAEFDTVGYQYKYAYEVYHENANEFYSDGATWEYPLFPNRWDAYHNDDLTGTGYEWRNGQSYVNNAVWFAEYRSYGNGKTYFEANDNYFLDLGGAFTRGDAIRAVERLYENVRFLDYIPTETVALGAAPETLELAAKMPKVSYNNLPAWKGYTISGRHWAPNDDNSGMLYTEDMVKRLSDAGFNFVRAPLDFNSIFIGTDMSQACVAFVETMDDLVNWCAQYGVHLCFDLHEMPGFSTDGSDETILFQDEATQELFTAFWGFMAEHYKDVPSNLLSFNLLNEPHGDNVTDEGYSAIMLKAIDAIRAVTPDRLIFVDMLGAKKGIPVEGLADAQVVQTVHPYFLNNGTQNWPSYNIYGHVLDSNGVLTLKGNFPAGTEILVDISMSHSVSTLTWASDNTLNGEFTIGGEAVGEGGCIEILEEGTDGECRSYENKIWTTVLKDACSELKLKQTGDGCWYMLDRITITFPSDQVTLIASREYVTTEKAPVLTINTDGTITAADKDTLLTLDKNTLKQQFQEYADFSARTGEAVMVQEFGFGGTIAYDATLSAAEDFFSVLDEFNIPWCSWNDDYGLWVNNALVESQKLLFEKDILRNGAVYEDLGGGWLLDTGLMEVYKRHME